MQQQQQQQQQPRIHRSIRNGIARLSDPNNHEERHKLIIDGVRTPEVDRQSLQHLVTFIDDRDSHEVITELDLRSMILSNPPNGELDVLCTFFARSDTTLTKVTLKYCDFGSQQDATRLLAAFYTNRTVTNLTIDCIKHLGGVALGNCISGLMQNMPQLQRLVSKNNFLFSEGVRAFQPVLRSNRTLKELCLYLCFLDDDGACLLVDSLVGNTTIELLDFSLNNITSAALPDIMRLIESTRVQTLSMTGNEGIFDNENANKQFATNLHTNTTMQELKMDLVDGQEKLRNTVNTICARNKSLSHVDFLLAPPPQQQQQSLPQSITGSSTSLFLLKTWHKAIVKFATDGPSGGNAGASAIFKLFTARPHLLEKRLKRPAAAAAAAVSQKEQKYQRL